jgi:hypothetical protein
LAGAGIDGFTSTGTDGPLVKKYAAIAATNNPKPIAINNMGEVFFFSWELAPKTDALFSGS